MKCKVKYKNFDRTLTIALLGDYSQNVPKPKRTQVKMYPTFVESKFTQASQNLPKWSQNIPSV